ncbi:MAG: hypothetical protein J6Y74_05355 [Clostridia bacterium]|nr:hypothetical protein [Clostridia bacterium]
MANSMDGWVVYFDMDGVLADFDRGVVELCHLPSQVQDSVSAEEEETMWGRIRALDRFYYKLEPIRGSVELFLKTYGKLGRNCQILTGIPKPKRGVLTAGEDKRDWAYKYLGKDVIVNIVYKEEKPNFCLHSKCVLIDDFAANIRQWEATGGIGILFESAESATKRLKELGVL